MGAFPHLSRNVPFCPRLSSFVFLGARNEDKSGQKRTNGDKTGHFVKVARLQSEFCTKDFFSSHEFSYEKCSEIFPEIFEPLFCGSEKIPGKFPPNVPLNFPNFPAKNQKQIHRRASAGAQGKHFGTNGETPPFSIYPHLALLKFSLISGIPPVLLGIPCPALGGRFGASQPYSRRERPRKRSVRVARLQPTGPCETS